MIRVGVIGAAGRMGSTVCRLVTSQSDMRLAAAIERAVHPELGKQLGDCRLKSSLGPSMKETDVLVDFATTDGLGDRAEACERAGKAYVCGVTGLSAETMSGLRRVGTSVPVVYAANFSVGVNVLYRLAADATRLLGPGFDIEIVETHHRQKRDAPSGTAKKLAELLCEARDTAKPRMNTDEHGCGTNDQERQGSGQPAVRNPESACIGGSIPVHSIRAGDVVGEHTVLFAGAGERLELTHRASGREAFASGVLLAIRFASAAGPGFYSMSDVLAVR